MRGKTMRFLIFMSLMVCTGLLAFPAPGDAKLYTAVQRKLAQKIMADGLNPRKFRPQARFNRAAYLSRRPSTAVAEKGGRSAVLAMQESAFLKNRTNILDLRNPTRNKLHDLLGNKHDLRGSYKNGVIGPKTGKLLGRLAGQRGKAIEYRSAKNGWTNLAIPKKLFERRPNIVSPVKILKGNQAWSRSVSGLGE